LAAPTTAEANIQSSRRPRLSRQYIPRRAV
jgi:hypothetical protein